MFRDYRRVLYLDIDCHHGDGVEEAFYSTNRVMTVSFHQYGEGFFPNSGHVNSKGAGIGKNYALNIPLKPGIFDENYHAIFKPVMKMVMQIYNPEVIVLQSGADSSAYDLIGEFNLSSIAHGEAVNFMLAYNLPTILLGGGGYNLKNVAKL